MASFLDDEGNTYRLLCAGGDGLPTAARIERGAYAVPADEVAAGDHIVVQVNGEIAVAVVHTVYRKRELTTTHMHFRIFMGDGTLGRLRFASKSNAGFVDRFMDDFYPEWADVEYGDLC